MIEHSIYVKKPERGRGWDTRDRPENHASLALHAAHGFRIVGVRERIGRMGFGPWAGRWRDNVFIERRC